MYILHYDYQEHNQVKERHPQLDDDNLKMLSTEFKTLTQMYI